MIQINYTYKIFILALPHSKANPREEGGLSKDKCNGY